MPELIQKVDTYRINYVCDSCAKGNMAVEKLAINYPGHFFHKCPNCGWSVWLPQPYPRIKMEAVDEKERLVKQEDSQSKQS